MKQTLGQQLREAREGQVLTQEELARKLRIPVRSLQAYEADAATPRPARRRAIIAWLERMAVAA